MIFAYRIKFGQALLFLGVGF